MDIFRASMVDAVRSYGEANCLILSFPLPDTLNSDAETEESRDVNLSQIFKGQKLIHIGSAMPELSGQQPDETIWKQQKMHPDNALMYALGVSSSKLEVRFFNCRSGK